MSLDGVDGGVVRVHPGRQRSLVTNHHVFGYLAQRFDFELVGAVVPGGTTLASPSAADLDDLASAIEDSGVRTIFAESSQPDRLVQVLADEVGLEVEVVQLYTESLTDDGRRRPDRTSTCNAPTPHASPTACRETGHHRNRRDSTMIHTNATTRRRRAALRATVGATAATLLLAACGSEDTSDEATEPTEETSAPASAGAQRLAVTYEDGVAVLDAQTLEVVEEFDTEEFTRLNPAGDGQHLMLTTSEGFQVLDAAAPALTDRVFEAETAGHVVRHAVRTVLVRRRHRPDDRSRDRRPGRGR